MFIVAQLWKQNNDRLENKNGVWMYMEETWILPNEKEDQVGELVRIKHNIKSQKRSIQTLLFFKILKDSQQWKLIDNVLQNKEGLWMSDEKWNFKTSFGKKQ